MGAHSCSFCSIEARVQGFVFIYTSHVMRRTGSVLPPLQLRSVRLQLFCGGGCGKKVGGDGAREEAELVADGV